jgi:ribonuclease P protein component
MKDGFTYGKEQKLKSRKLITKLFAEGKAVNAFPLRLVYANPEATLDFPVKAGVSVSSRNFKKAVDRNRIKRLLRETYRLNQAGLLKHVEEKQQRLVLFIIYTDKVLPDFDSLNQKMQVALNKLIAATSERTTPNT